MIITNVSLSGMWNLKMTHAQELIQPVSSFNTEINPLFKNILQECTVAVNSHSPDITKLQDCDQKVTSIRLECDKNQPIIQSVMIKD